MFSIKLNCTIKCSFVQNGIETFYVAFIQHPLMIHIWSDYIFQCNKPTSTVPVDKFYTLVTMYRAHSQRILDSVNKFNFSEVYVTGFFFWTKFRNIYQLGIGGFSSFGPNSLSFSSNSLSFLSNSLSFFWKPWVFLKNYQISRV